jgi:hypothetical protein
MLPLSDNPQSLRRKRRRPATQNTPILVVDPNGMLILTRSLQFLESVARRNPQILELCGGMHHIQFAPRGILDPLPLPYSFVVEEPLGIFCLERSNHTPII